MKWNKIIYWSLTGFFAAGMLMSSFIYLTKNEELLKGFEHLGYPTYMLAILGTAKLLGALALVQPWLEKLKEWAYAGFTFTLIGAIWSHIAMGDPFLAPMLFLAVLGLSYFFRQRTEVRGILRTATI